MMLRIFTPAVFALAVSVALAQPVTIKNGFGSGEDYLKMSPSEQRA